MHLRVEALVPALPASLLTTAVPCHAAAVPWHSQQVCVRRQWRHCLMRENEAKVLNTNACRGMAVVLAGHDNEVYDHIDAMILPEY
eukprot:2248075-Prorocentrum_lima.AAC.1